MWNVSVARGWPRAGRGGASSGVGVLDRAVAILDAIEGGSRTFTDVVRATALNRSTVHRLLASLEAHGLVARVAGRGYRLGSRLQRLAAAASRDLPLREAAHPALVELGESTGESAQLFVRSGDRRVCIDAVDSDRELRTIVAVGASLPLTAGSAGKVLTAWAADRDRLVKVAERYTDRTPLKDDLDGKLVTTRRRGWAESAGERAPGVASVSAPVFGTGGQIVAAVSVSGPEQRLGARPGRRHAQAVVAAARRIEAALG
jgi:DNA-binding IclR family transcriptional regulator